MFEIKRRIVQRTAVFVQMLDEFGDAAFVIKLVRFFRVFAFVFDIDANAFVQKCFFAQTFRQFFKTVNRSFQKSRRRV